MDKPRQDLNQWRRELDDLVRGASGGFLFGIPLLYTMEVWWIGASMSMSRVLLAMMLTFAIVFMLNRTAGFRETVDQDWHSDAMDSVEAMAIGFLCASFMLILLQEITLKTPLNEALGKIVYEGVPFTLGVALANQFLSGDENNSEKGQSPSPSRAQESLRAALSDIGGTLIGAIIIAFNIAPTEEIPSLAAAVNGLWLLGIMAASLVISYMIVFAAGFTKQAKRHQQRGLFQRPSGETITSYLLSLFAALGMLLFFGKLDSQMPWQSWVSYTIVLGLPATIGGAAGRLAV
jgi:putative integral membrane protein (TIGR02587 family)